MNSKTATTAETTTAAKELQTKVILSGMRPTGPLHLGHLLGALKNWKKLQDEGNICFYMIADWHALSTEYEKPQMIRNNTFEIAIDYLSCGLDPEKSTIFIQSLVQQHIELHMIFSMIVPVPWLERNPVYKEQIAELQEKELHTYGFLGYPVLMASDIMVYKATHIPVGIDQLPHIELTREIVRRFNFFYKDYFNVPESLLTETPKLPGTDGRKMSKSYGNCIYLKENPKDIKKKILSMFTDPKRIYKKDPGHPDECPVFAYHTLFNKDHQKMKNMCLSSEIGCVECKRILSEIIVEFLKSIQEKRKELEKDPEKVWKILKQGTEKASIVAEKTLKEIKNIIGINYEKI
jgi:tryptophanyl-tRNA synthetase